MELNREKNREQRRLSLLVLQDIVDSLKYDLSIFLPRRLRLRLRRSLRRKVSAVERKRRILT